MSRGRRFWWAVAAVVALLIPGALLVPGAARAAANPVGVYGALTSSQRADLRSIARDTWKFYGADIDQATSLPMDNVTFAGGSAAPTGFGRYTSASNIGVYLWAVVAARDLGLVTEAQAQARIQATLTEVSHLKRDHGLLYQWYDTTNGNVLVNPGQGDDTGGYSGYGVEGLAFPYFGAGAPRPPISSPRSPALVPSRSRAPARPGTW